MRFNLPRLIGITGRSGSGKDTLADYLVSQHGFAKYSLAKPIKDLLNERFGWDEKDWLDREWKEAESTACGYFTSVEKVGGETFLSDLNVRHYFSPRTWAQWLGTEVGRTIGGEDVWVNMMEREWERMCDTAFRHSLTLPMAAARCSMVVPDVRFDNEARRIHSLGGVVIRVLRPDATAVAAHVSEKGVSDELVNVEVTNDRDVITFLRESVYALEGCPRG